MSASVGGAKHNADLVIVEAFGSGNGLALLKSARELGLVTAFLTKSIDRYRNDLDRDILRTADPSLILIEGVSTRDSGSIAQVLASSFLVGTPVISQVDKCQLEVARAAELAGFPTLLGSRLISACVNKDEFRRILQAAGVDPVSSAAIDLSEPLRYRPKISAARPVIVKPARGTGSVGVRLVTNQTEFAQAVSELVAAGDRVAQIEEYLVGALISAEVFRWKGCSTFIGLTDRVLSEPPHFAELSWTFPLTLSVATEQAVRSIVDLTLDALCFNDGPVHVELILTSHGPRIVEVNPRFAGRGLTRITSDISSYDTYELLIAAVHGRAPTVKRVPPDMFGSEHVISGDVHARPARSALATARKLPHVTVTRTISADSEPQGFGGLYDLGEARALGPSFAEAQMAARSAAHFLSAVAT